MRLTKLASVIFAYLVAFHAPALAYDQNGPNLWKVADEDTTVYIFGTIHMLNEEVEWVTPQLQQAFQEAGALVLELTPDQQDQAVIQPLILKYGLMTDGETLQTTLSEEDYANLTGALEKLGAPGNALDSMQPWLAATFLSVQTAAAHGFLPDYGVEKILEQSAKDNEMPIYGLETAEYQISALAGPPAEEQNKFLSITLAEIDNVEEVFIEMRDAWLAGDVDALDAIVNQDMDLLPNFAEAILYQRNRNWAGEVASMLDELEGTLLIAVGTGHLVGKDNLLEILEKNGVEVILVE